MKHLRRYNESLDDTEVDELKDFCETSLAYLMDEGFEISCTENKYLYLSLPGKQLRYSLAKDPFDWNDIKDHFIPFVQLLSRRYELKHFGDRRSDHVVLFQGDRNKYATVEQVINDDLPTAVYHNLWCIVIEIRNKI